MATTTAASSNGFGKGNLAILPEKSRIKFHRFCQLNPKAVPDNRHVRCRQPQNPNARARSRQLRTDRAALPVWRDGEGCEERPTYHGALARRLVPFVLGCSFSFEEALMATDLPIRHIERNQRVPMYRTNIPCQPAGPFAGPMVVSMRPFKPADAIRAVQITSRFPSVHGAPVHLGHPHSIGIAISQSPTMAIRCRSSPTKFRCSGPAASRRKR
jgi:uncharacterized protein YcsI (UPF0317 family)